MKGLKQAIAISGVALLTACSGYHSNNAVNELNNTEASGSPFTKFLADEYRVFSNSEHHEMFDYHDALHFARKGLASANGDVVMPETLEEWDLDENSIEELTGARDKLSNALESGGREIAADKAAIAQAKFDCWVEQQEENFQADDIAVCKKEFDVALANLLEALKPAEVVVEAPVMEMMPVVAVTPEPEAVPLEQAMFIVFFDWDKSKLSSGANDVLRAVESEVSTRDDITKIIIEAHTDSSGPTKYNQRLSMKRASAIKDGLIGRGISKDIIEIRAKGENDLLVKTADNVREPANRRAQISFE